MLLKATNLDVMHGFGTRTTESVPEVITGRQVHGDRVLRVDGPIDGEECDALVSQTPGVRIGVLTADCVPILLADRQRRVVAAVHAGWRGTARGIAAKAVMFLHRELDVAPETLSAALGPAVSACCYEVSRDVAQAVSDSVGGPPIVQEKPHIDLRAHVRLQLSGAGVPSGAIEIVGECTMCHPDDYFSYRREGKGAGRHVSFISL